MANKKKLSRKEKLLKKKLTTAERKEIQSLTNQEVEHFYVDINIASVIPVVGLILYYKYRKEYPNLANNILTAAILGPIIIIASIFFMAAISEF